MCTKTITKKLTKNSNETRNITKLNHKKRNYIKHEKTQQQHIHTHNKTYNRSGKLKNTNKQHIPAQQKN